MGRALDDSTRAVFAPVLVLLHLWFGTVVWGATLDPTYTCILDSVLMPIHEGGHLLFSLLGTWMGVLGGSLLQWLVPVLLIGSFARQRDAYAVCAGVMALGLSLRGSYVYMDSAFHGEKYPDMMVVSLGDPTQEGIHDWQYLFGSLKLYHESERIVAGVHALYLTLLWGGWLAGAWVLSQLLMRQAARWRS